MKKGEEVDIFKFDVVLGQWLHGVESLADNVIGETY
jgi:hypothetical protein